MAGSPIKETNGCGGLRNLLAADFHCEEEVEYHILEPILRLAQIEKRARIQRRYDLRISNKNKTADYAVFGHNNQVRCIIEAKLDLGEGTISAASPEYAQANEYARASKAPAFILADRNRMLYFRRNGERPCLRIECKSLAEEDLVRLSSHVLAEF
jgi:hypothetical protein